MGKFEHVRHKPPSSLSRQRELLLVVAPLRSSVNLSRMVRLAGCCAITKIIHAGPAKVDRNIARNATNTVAVETRRSLPPVLKRLSADGYRCVGLEQTTHSSLLYDFEFQRRTALVVGAERDGLSQEVLDCLDDVVEIPVYGQPASYNVVTATTMATYEYCRQFPRG